MKNIINFKRKSMAIRWIIAVIAILCLGGIGTGVYFIAFQSYEIEVVQNDNGIISPKTALFKKGANAEFEVTANEGYQIEKVIVDGEEKTPENENTDTYKLNFDLISKSHTVTASFIKKAYAINISQPEDYESKGTCVVKQNGVLLNGKAEWGSDIVVSITANEGYYISSLKLGGEVVAFSSPKPTTHNLELSDIKSIQEIEVDYSIKTYSITVVSNSEDGGTISPETASYDYGSNFTFTITPNEGYEIENVIVDGESKGNIQSYTFTNITEAHTISATFFCDTLEKLSFTLNEDNNSYNVKAKDSSITGMVVIPSTYLDKPVTKIESVGFAETAITSIIIPSSIVIIGESALAFANNLLSIKVDSDNINYSSLDGNLYNKNKTTFIQFAGGKNLAIFEIPNGVETIGVTAFYGCQGISNVKLPSTLIRINDSAFAASYLREIIIPNSVTSIGSVAFASCSHLISVTFEITDLSQIVNIGGGGGSAFDRISSNCKVYIPASSNVAEYAGFLSQRGFTAGSKMYVAGSDIVVATSALDSTGYNTTWLLTP